MIQVENRKLCFTFKRIWFSESIFNVHGCSCIVFREVKHKIRAPEFTCRLVMNSIIDLTQSLDEIWHNMKKSSCRYSIKQAERSGVVIKINQNFDEFYKIYINHAHKKNLRWFEIESLETIKKYGLLFTAEYKGKVLGGHVYLIDENNMLYWIAASDRYVENKQYRTLVGNASHLIHWEAIKYAKLKNVKEFNLSLLNNEKDDLKDSLNMFKESFGGKRIFYYTYYKDYNYFLKIARFLKTYLNYMNSDPSSVHES